MGKSKDAGKGKGKQVGGVSDEGASKGKGKGGSKADGLGTCTYVKGSYLTLFLHDISSAFFRVIRTYMNFSV